MPTDDNSKIESLLNNGVAEVIVKADLEKKLKSGKKMRIKLGIDPTGFDLHLGHMTVVHKLREFQALGHQIILLFGNFTGQIGDPSGKNETRPMRTQAELENNAQHYLKQVSCILDVKKVEVRWNADWLAKLNFSDVVNLASRFTVSQMLERDMFQERIKNDKPISIHEFMYPLMQGYDSVALKADVELGGTDQTFNLLAGRTIQKAYGMEAQNILTVPILIGTDGSMKMGKTTGNYIGVLENPFDVFGKAMSIPDDLIVPYFELAARVSGIQIKKYKDRLKKGENPKNLKMELAQEIVKLYHGEKIADKAKENFVNIFQKKVIPNDIPEFVFKINEELNIVDLLYETKMIATKSDGRRLIEAGAVKVDQNRVEDITTMIKVEKSPLLIQIGKRNFLKIHC